MEPGNYIDRGKRGRLAILAFGLTLTLFILRAFEYINPNSVWHVFIMSASYFFITYIGLVWAFRFQINKKSLFLIIPQSAFFATAQIAFVMLFFFRDFERVYEFFLLFLLLLGITVTTYVSFLMSNIFNVASFKHLPLVEVAKTTSYILTVLVIYFATFAALSLQLSIPFVILTLFFSLFSAITFHISHFDTTYKQKTRAITLITVSMIGVAVSTLFLGSQYELSALIPVSVAFIMLGIEMNNKNDNKGLKWYTKLQYLIVISAVVMVNFLVQ